MTEPRNDREYTRGKPFEAGNPGKPKGARSRATVAAEALLNGEAEKLTRTAIDKALEGDSVALRLCLERLVPPRKDSPITIDLPPITTAGDVVSASAAVLTAVGAGEISPDEAGRVMALLTAHKNIVETGDLERRIAALEVK
ncbi:hypothetical protein ASE75_13680 [Sphingomonas sp. Leaf17]|uniref:hypothetical protein n=1 Tax=Sphingomonas sp. Leaf17 TaxID=1735683 RepID=UPI0006F22A96|nr:hypothetical protein [Sphingomonas sp. Leaf17]KQM62675.1 hypothetical protein ASE75_13680 [Sphingomonas sp. Leaf17]